MIISERYPNDISITVRKVNESKMISIDQNKTEISILFSRPFGFRFNISPRLEQEKYQNGKLDRLNCDKGSIHRKNVFDCFMEIKSLILHLFPSLQ
ncbi:hypothetical protein DK846_15065 [Methanospirillum lacunae]|uniref:Uncharacterized protein n=1 Tax=Methanospirillum lacunae TaxID=668570 RepID=A0A2V2MYB9_9EURY|nr:hypothetical protein DK846_15065 [Methanospirillum lacunae]